METTIWLCYTDDVFLVRSGSLTEFNRLLNFVTAMHQRIRKKLRSSLAFLIHQHGLYLLLTRLVVRLIKHFPQFKGKTNNIVTFMMEL